MSRAPDPPADVIPPPGLVLLGPDAAADVDAAAAALAPAERALLDAFQAAKRRGDWLRGRLAARAAVQALLRAEGDLAGAPGLAVLTSPHGAPRVEGVGGGAPVAVTVSHGHGRAAAWALRSGPGGGLPGVDLERLRARPPGTFRFYLDPDERAWVHAFAGPPAGAPAAAARGAVAGDDDAVDRAAPASPRDRAALVLWALKEAAFKALRPPRGLGLLDVRARLAGPLEGPGGPAAVTFVGGLADRAAALGCGEVRAAWRVEGDLVLAWVLAAGARLDG